MGRIFARLQTKLIILVLLSSLPALGVILAMNQYYRAEALSQEKTELSGQAERFAQYHQDMVERAENILRLLTHSQVLRGQGNPACERFLAGVLHDLGPVFANLLVVSPEGMETCNAVAPGKYVNLSDRGYFIKAMATGKVAVGKYIVGRTTGTPVIGLAYPFVRDGRVQFLTATSLQLERINQLSRQHLHSKDLHLTIIDPKGTVLLRTSQDNQKSWIGKPIADTPLGHAMLNASTRSTFVGQDLSGQDDLFAFTPLGPKEAPYAYLSLGIPLTTLYAKYDRLLSVGVGAGVIALFFGLLVAAVGSRRFLNTRVEPLIQTVRALRQGHLAERAPNLEAGGELDELAFSINKMASSLERKERETQENLSALREGRERFELVLNASDLGYWDIDFKTGAVAYSESWAAMLDYSLADIGNGVQAWIDLVHPEDRPSTLALWQKHLNARSASFESEFRMRTRSETWRWILSRGRVMARSASGVALRAAGTHLDITDRKQAEERLEFLAHHDPLTGLLNRYYFGERAQSAIQLAQRMQQQVAVFLMDLDRFQTINDSLGHGVGDQLLRGVSARLQAEFSAESHHPALLARMGGDEFTLLVEGVSDADAGALVVIAQRILACFSQSFEVEGHVLSMSTSIGIARYPLNALDLDQLLRQADAALYVSKSEGRNGFRFFSCEMATAAEERMEMESGLRQALAGNEFSLVYQPQVDLASGRLIGFEALARWKHPVKGWISPLQFIPVAEDSGLIVPLGRWVLFTACAQIRQWQDQGLEIGHVAVNVSAIQMERGALVEDVRHALSESGIDPDHLELEITESFILNDPEEAARALNELRALGVHLAIDDFGTGYSSLLYLKRLPFDLIKIDQGFVRDMLDDPQDEAIVRSIIALGQSLDLQVLAEGVETLAHAQQLYALGCGLAQGYHYGKPVSASEVTDKNYPGLAD
jgi:diguanylate cyclase (GGDEF)-like protein/PAS domain S-box-containing protein